jgi:hypothetical protein
MLVFFAPRLATSISGEPAIGASASWTLVITGAAVAATSLLRLVVFGKEGLVELFLGFWLMVSRGSFHLATQPCPNGAQSSWAA